MRFHRADLPFETSQAIYDRMKSERQREAKELRAQGFEWAQQIQARADRDRTVILSEAQRAATISRGEGDAEANRMLADAFGKDPQFYPFYRALQTYRTRSPIPARRWCCRPTRISCASSRTARSGRSAPPRAAAGARDDAARARAPRPPGAGGEDGLRRRSRLARHSRADFFRRPAARRRQRAADRDRLPALGPEDARKAILLGAGGAIVLRLVLTVAGGSLLAVPLVKLVGAWLLIVIALNVTAEHGSNGDEDALPSLARGDLWSAATVIIVADAAMSLDNVVALAAIARGNFWLLAAGVVLSIPVLAYGGLVLSPLLTRRSVAGRARRGAARLDRRRHGGLRPLVAGWAVNAPCLVAIAPALGAVFVFFGWWAPGRPAPRSIARPAPKPAVKPAAPAALAPASARPSAAALARAGASARRASPEDRFAVVGVLILALIAGLVLMSFPISTASIESSRPVTE